MITKKKTPILLLVAIAAFLTSCKKEKQAETASSQNWKTIVLKLSDASVTTEYTASIKGQNDVEIRPQVAGIIKQVSITEGARVKKGQVLFVLDQVTYQAELSKAVANVRLAKAALATAKLTCESRKKLAQEKVVSDFDLQTSQNNLISAEATLAQAAAEEMNARNNLSFTVVKSPVDGVVGNLPYRQGALVNSQINQPLTTVSDTREMYVYFSLNETELLNMAKNSGSVSKAIQTMKKVQLRLSDNSLYSEKGKVESISGLIDTSTGAANIRVKFPNPNGFLQSGGTGKVLIPQHFDHVIVIPQTATVRSQDKVLVYKVVDGKSKSVLVQGMPIDNGQEYLVNAGLNQGDKIVAEGAGLVHEGMDIK